MHLSAIAVGFFLSGAVPGYAGTATMHVKLDRETFPPKSLITLQNLADRVAATIDRLIPGRVTKSNQPEFLCYIAPDFWRGAAYDPPPITLIGAARLGEPKAARAGTVRIALDSLVLPNHAELVYELAHELAHVKMDPRYDNYLVETLAVAASLEALTVMGFEQARKMTLTITRNNCLKVFKLL